MEPQKRQTRYFCEKKLPRSIFFEPDEFQEVSRAELELERRRIRNFRCSGSLGAGRFLGGLLGLFFTRRDRVLKREGGCGKI